AAPRHAHQRRAPLDQSRHFRFPAGGTRQADGGAVRRELSGAPSRRGRNEVPRRGETGRGRGPDRRAAAGAARLRFGRADRRGHDRHAVAGRRAHAQPGDHGSADAAAGRVARAVHRLPRQAPHLVPRSLEGSVRQRLPADASLDRGRARQVVRRGPWWQRAEIVLPAGSAHRFHPRGDRRGTRLRRRAVRASIVRAAGRTRPATRPARRRSGPAPRGLRRVRAFADGGAAGAGVGRREPGRAADQGADAAADQFRRIEHADDVRDAGRVAARGVRNPPRRGRAADGDAAAGRFACIRRDGSRPCRTAAGGAQAHRADARRGARMSNVQAPVLIMAGGTGGHIFPGLAVAAALRARNVPVLWLGAEGGMENRIVPEHHLALKTLHVRGLRGKGLAQRIAAPWMLVRALVGAWRALREANPRSVLSMGGYVAGPGGIAAWLQRRPVLVHEQNRIAGFTNRALAKVARKVMAGFADAFPAKLHAEWTGNPVRADIAALPAPEVRFADRTGAPRLLVLGGSLGARTLNHGLPNALSCIPAERRPEVRHQCGAKHVEATRAAYACV